MVSSNSRVLVVAGYAPSLINFRGDFIRALVEKGCDVYCCAPSLADDYAVVSALESIGAKPVNIDFNRVGISPLRDIFLLFNLFFLIRNISPDRVFLYTIKPVVYGGIAAWLAGVPKIYHLITGLGYAFSGDGGAGKRIIQRIVFFLYKSSLSHSACVFFQNPDDLSLFKSLGIVKKETVCKVVNGSGVNVQRFSLVPVSNAPNFLLIARLLKDKGIREYVEAAVIVKKINPSARFLVVGWVDNNPNSISHDEVRMWSELGVEFIGKLDDVRPAIAECSVYVLPSYREGTPRTVLEAMSMGRAVITTDAPGCRETVVDGENGFLIPIKDSEALSVAMLRFIDDPSLIKTMGNRSRELAEEKYSVEKVNVFMLDAMGIE